MSSALSANVNKQRCKSRNALIIIWLVVGFLIMLISFMFGTVSSKFTRNSTIVKLVSYYQRHQARNRTKTTLGSTSHPTSQRTAGTIDTKSREININWYDISKIDNYNRFDINSNNSWTISFENKSDSSLNNGEIDLLDNMIVNVGVRSAGTTELQTKLQNEFGFESVCWGQRIKTQLEPISVICHESHFWDRWHCLRVYKSYNYSNYHIVADIDNDGNEYGTCSVKQYINIWQENYKNSKNFTNFNQTINDTLFFDKTPRYYLYPHIAFIFSKHKLFFNLKVFLIVIDTIKTSLSTFYDQANILEKNRKDGYKKYFENHVLTNDIFNFIKDNFVAKYLPPIYLKNCFYSDCTMVNIYNNNNTSDNNNNIIDKDYENHNWIDSLRNSYNNIEDRYFKMIYVQEKGHNFNDLASGSSTAFRNCPIIPLISWFKQFDYFDLFFQILSQKERATNDYNSQKKESLSRRNRFKIVQSEYFFQNLEKVSNQLNCWARGYNPHDNCRSYPSMTSQSWSLTDNNAKQYKQYKPYKWVKLKNESGSVPHSHSHRVGYNSVPKDYLYQLAQYFYPCTVHTIHFLQTLNQSRLILGTFDPNLWQLAISPIIGQTL